MENASQQEEPQFQRQTVSFPQAAKPKKKIGLKILILFILLSVIGGIAWFLLNNDNPFSGSVSISPTPQVGTELPTSTPSPTPMAVSKTDLQVQVQNGTGVPGEAAFLETEVKKLGFTTVETGNADNKNYTATEVSFSSRVPEDVKTELTTKLQELYTSVKVSDSSSAGIDIRIITGTRKGAKAASSPTPTVRGTSTTGTITPTKAATTGTTTITPTKTPAPTISN